MKNAAAPADRHPPVVAVLLAAAIVAGVSAPVPARAEGNVYYICPGNVFTNTITAKEAEQRGCRAREAQQPTTIPAPRVRSGGGPAAARASDARVSSDEQRERDADSRRILEDELQKAQARLDALRKEYNNGQPERLGNERNYQKYLDRVADLKASIARTESDVEALKRELAKHPPAQ